MPDEDGWISVCAGYFCDFLDGNHTSENTAYKHHSALGSKLCHCVVSPTAIIVPRFTILRENWDIAIGALCYLGCVHTQNDIAIQQCHSGYCPTTTLKMQREILTADELTELLKKVTNKNDYFLYLSLTPTFKTLRFDHGLKF